MTYFDFYAKHLFINAVEKALKENRYKRCPFMVYVSVSNCNLSIECGPKDTFYKERGEYQDSFEIERKGFREQQNVFVDRFFYGIQN